MPAHPDAILQDQEGRSILRFERILDHPPERVWRALTDAAEQSSWHPTPFELEPFVGGKVTYLGEGKAPDMPAGEITDYDPPRLVAHTWDQDLLRWELEAHGDRGCRLVLLHTFDDRFKAARDAAGWHLCLDALSIALDGAEPPSAWDGSEPSVDWRSLNSAYEKRFDIPAAKATPPPGG